MHRLIHSGSHPANPAAAGSAWSAVGAALRRDGLGHRCLPQQTRCLSGPSPGKESRRKAAPTVFCNALGVFARTILLFGALVAAVAAHAQLGEEIARKHAARAGDRLAALTALRAEGRTFIAGEVVPFLSLAERPNRLRVESFTPLRRVVQVYDGEHPPWISHTEVKAGAPREMNAGEAKDSIANADFDGPLLNHAAKGYSVDYAGEEVIFGRAALNLLVMNKSDDIFFLWVDGQTYEVVKRTVYRVFNNRRVAVDTYFKDFREVGGVLQPHRIETESEGRTIYVMLIDRMVANPATIPADAFARPGGG